MKKFLTLFIILALVISFAACSDDESESTDPSDTSSDTTTQSTDQTSDDSESTDTGNSDVSSSDSDKDPDDSSDEPAKVDIPKIDYDVDIENAIKANTIFNPSNNTFGNEGSALSYLNIVDIDVARFAAGGKTQVITQGGLEHVYRIFGTSSNGQIRIRAEGQDVYIILDNLNLTYNGDESPVYAEKCKSVTIILADGSVNTITDSVNNTKKGAIYVKSSNLTVDGSGTLNINANYKSGIFNTKELAINGGKFNITSNYHGIYGEQKLTINGGTFNINSTRSGLKSGDYDEAVPNEAVEGSIVINGGYIKTDAKTNCISSYGDLIINNGWLELKAGTNGIDTTKDIAINGGTTIITSQDDGIKTDRPVNIKNDANVKIETNGDGINASDLDISTSGMVYIKTVSAYVSDNENGIYIRDNGVYYRVDTKDFPNREWYSVVNSTKALKITNAVKISSGIVGIASSEDAINATSFEMLGGTLYITTNEDAVSTVNTEISGDSKLYILKCYKGLKSDNNVTVNGGVIVCVPLTDSIKTTNSTVINGAELYLFDAVDFGVGEFTINGGNVFMLATKKNAVIPSKCNVKYFSDAISDSSLYTYGNFVKIHGDNVNLVIRIPKNYSSKAAIFVCADNMTESSYNVDIGVYLGSIVYPLVYDGNGTFSSEGTQTINSK